MNEKPILITGSHRSGTTWVGRMISASPQICYIHEPFTPKTKHWPGLDNQNTNFKHWFTYITSENEDKYASGLKKTLSYDYSFFKGLKRAKGAKDIADAVKNWPRFAHCRSQDKRPLIKDPLAFFSAGWLAEKFNMEVIVLIRHPAAFASSLKRLNWRFDFSNFLNQPLFLRDYLAQFRREIKDFVQNKKDILDQAILLWRIIYFVTKKYQNRHKDWIFVRHEDLSVDPEKLFKKIFKKLNLEFTKEVKKHIQRYSSVSNPSEVPGEDRHSTKIKRNSRANIYNFKKRLSQEEIEKIKKETEDIWRFFYQDKDW